MNLTELRRLAEAATPGPWIDDPECSPCHVFSSHIPAGKTACIAPLVCETLPVTSRKSGYGLANAAFIAAANPATLLRLLDVVEAAQAFCECFSEEYCGECEARLRAALAALESGGGNKR